MKRKLVVFTVFLLATLMTNAQLYLGAKVGLNFANLSTSVANTAYNKKIGINGGGTLKFNFNNTFGAQMDVLFSQMGSNAKSVNVVDNGDGTTSTTTTEELHDYTYVQIPVFANLEIPIKSENLIPYRITHSAVSIHFMGGFYFGYNIGNSVETSQKTATTDGLGNTSITVAPKTTLAGDLFFNPIDLGIAAAAGVSFRLSPKGRLTVDGRYLMGIFRNSTNLFAPDAFNRAVQVQLGYIHRISRLRRWQIE
ncbi:MAG: PorT family protein [Flavobacteriales bacterium]|nr:PorT family protein [Flavobacteriales bacterium]